MRRGGFSLVEISIVLVVVATMLAGVLPAITEGTKVKDIDTTADRMEEIQKAIQAYFSTNQELPCPADITLGVNTANFGVQAANNSCTGGAPAANFFTPNVASPGPYDVVGGGVPTKTLGLPDEYAFDGWGRRLYYHVDPDATVVGTFNASGTIIVDDGVAGAPYRTSTAVYALVSGGRNGHGAYTRAGGTVRVNTGSQNTDESRNCMTTTNSCTGPIVMTYDNIFVQKLEAATDPNDPTTNFDDIVSYKLRGSLLTGDAGGGDTLWTASGANIYNTNAGSVGIGTATPVGKLEVVGEGGWNSIINRIYSNGAHAAVLSLSRGRGTIAAPSYPLSGDLIGLVTYRNYAAGVGAGIQVSATENHTAAAWGSQMQFQTVANGTTTAPIRMTIANDGNVGIGTTAPASLGSPATGPALHIHGSGTGPVDMSSVNLSSQASASGSHVGAVNFGSTAIAGADKRIASIAALKGGAGTQGDLYFYINNGASWVIPLVLTNTDKVGIGTTTPTSGKLQVSSGVGGGVNAIDATSTSGAGSGVRGVVDGAAATGNGVTGDAQNGSNGTGVWGRATGAGIGVLGENTAGAGGNVGVRGRSATNHGVLGDVSSGNATFYGVLGQNGGNWGALGRSDGYAFVGAGHVWATGNGYFAGNTYPSDVRLKENIVEIKGSLDKLMELHPVHYTWKEQSEQAKAVGLGMQTGLIAQEVEKIAPELVTTMKASAMSPSAAPDGKPIAPDKRRPTLNEELGETKGVDYSKLVPYLIGAVQELNQKVDSVAEGKPLEKGSAKDAPTPTLSHSSTSIGTMQLPQWLLVVLAAQTLGIVVLAVRGSRR